MYKEIILKMIFLLVNNFLFFNPFHKFVSIKQIHISNSDLSIVSRKCSTNSNQMALIGDNLRYQQYIHVSLADLKFQYQICQHMKLSFSVNMCSDIETCCTLCFEKKNMFKNYIMDYIWTTHVSKRRLQSVLLSFRSLRCLLAFLCFYLIIVFEYNLNLICFYFFNKRNIFLVYILSQNFGKIYIYM